MLTEIEKRKSIRKYTAEPVTDEEIRELVYAATLSPSGHNVQPWRFMVVRDPAMKEEIVKIDNNQTWMLAAPVFLVCVGDIRGRLPEGEFDFDETSDTWELKQTIRDTAIAISYLMLEAQHMGLSTCWTGAYPQRPMKELLGIPSDQWIGGIVTIGHAAHDPPPRPRFTVDEVLKFEKW